MDLGITGKTAIITGGSAGIGLACAKALFKEGLNIAIAARNKMNLKKALIEIENSSNGKEKFKVITIVADMIKSEDIQRIVKLTFKQFKRIDILINNAGSARAGAFFNSNDRVFLDAWNLKFLGYIRMVRAVIPYMNEQKDGRIVNIIGTAARTPSPNFLPGSTTNAALLNFTKGISKEIISNGIRINAISPGPTATKRIKLLNKQTAEARGISEQEVWNESIKSIPLGRMVEPDEIAAMAMFLVSDLASSITGTEIIIDGGSTPGI